MGAAVCKVWSESISSYILHPLFVWYRWNSTCWVVFRESLKKKCEIREAATDGEGLFLEGFEVGLEASDFVK